jgi:hypothetical protein
MIPLILMQLGCTPDAPKPSLLLLTVQGVRADRVGAYGYNPTDTPHLDALAGRGTKFSRAYATSTNATTSLTSIMTGVNPPVHGTRISTDESAYCADKMVVYDEAVRTGEGPPRANIFPNDVGERGGFLRTLQDNGYDTRSTRQVNLPALEQLRHFDFATRSLLDNLDRSDKWFETNANDVEVWVVHFPSVAKMDGRSLSTREYDAALRNYDEYIGKLLVEWTTFRPNGYVVVAGVTGSLNGARADAAIGLTDDLLRVPLVVQGPNVEAGWEVSEVVSTVDVAATVADFLGTSVESQGRNLLSGGSEFAYHESTYGYERFNTRPLVGYTETSGRYVEGVYGRWSMAVKEKVLPFEMPTSEYPEKAQTLAKLRAGFGPDQGLPGGAWDLQLDVRERERLDSLVNKFEQAISNGRTAAATRILIRLRESAPSAPIVSILEGKLQKLSAAVPD